MVLHRALIFKALSETLDQWTPLYHDPLHFAPAAYHAFNGALLDMIVGSEAVNGKNATAEPQDDVEYSGQGILIAELDI